jgi:hypothetical protein
MLRRANTARPLRALKDLRHFTAAPRELQGQAHRINPRLAWQLSIGILTDMDATSASDARSPKIRHNDKAVDVAPQIGVQELLTGR